MFKKLYTFFTKFASIRSVVEWIYKGVLIAIDAFELIQKEIREIKPDFKYDDLMTTVISYMEKASDALALVLRWLGANLDGIQAEAKAAVGLSANSVSPDAAPVAFANKVKLDEIGDDLKKFVEEHK